MLELLLLSSGNSSSIQQYRRGPYLPLNRLFCIAAFSSRVFPSIQSRAAQLIAYHQTPSGKSKSLASISIENGVSCTKEQDLHWVRNDILVCLYCVLALILMQVRCASCS